MTLKTEDRLIQVIKNALPAEATPWFISVIGSRAKGLSGDASDYDVRAIVSYPKRAYMLGQQHNTFKIKAELDGVEVEGTAVDLLVALRYCVETNPFAYDALNGVRLFETDVSDQLRALFKDSFDQAKIRSAISGQINGYMKKKACGVGNTKLVAENNKTTNKIACEAAYLAVKLRFINQNANQIPPFEISELIEASFAPEEIELRQMIEAIVKGRIENKNGDFNVTSDFSDFLADTLKAEHHQTTFKKSKKMAAELNIRKDELFLSLFDL